MYVVMVLWTDDFTHFIHLEVIGEMMVHYQMTGFFGKRRKSEIHGITHDCISAKYLKQIKLSYMHVYCYAGLSSVFARRISCHKI